MYGHSKSLENNCRINCITIDIVAFLGLAKFRVSPKACFEIFVVNHSY
jgi:hypothetical protein